MNNCVVKDKVKTIKIALSIEEYQEIKAVAEKRKLTLQEYTKMKLLDNEEGLDSIRRYVACTIPKYNAAVGKIGDPQLKKQFYEWEGALCQLLR